MYNAPLPVIRDVCSPLGSAHISRGRHMSWLAAHSKCYVGLLHGGTRHRYTHRAWSKSVDVGLMWRLERVTQLYTGLSSTRSRSTRMLEITGGRSVINIRCRHRTLLYRLVLSRLLCEAAEVRWAGESWSLLEDLTVSRHSNAWYYPLHSPGHPHHTLRWYHGKSAFSEHDICNYVTIETKMWSRQTSTSILGPHECKNTAPPRTAGGLLGRTEQFWGNLQSEKDISVFIKYIKIAHNEHNFAQPDNWDNCAITESRSS